MGEHWRKPHPKRSVRERPSAIAEVAALLRGIFHVEWLPFDETRAAVRRRFAGHKKSG
jgi:hypothetical protein